MLKFLVFFILIYSSLATAWSPRDILIGLDPQPSPEILRPKDSLPLVEVRDDIGLLIQVISEGYGGWTTFQPQLEKEIFPALKAARGRSTDELCHEIGNQFDKIQDHHLNVNYSGAKKRCKSSDGGPGLVGKNIQTDLRLPWGYFERHAESGQKVPVLSVVHCDFGTSEGWNGFLEIARKIYSHESKLIVDLRGNSGGDESKLAEFARIFYGLDDNQVSLTPAGRLIRTQSSTAFALSANTIGLNILEKRWSGQADPPASLKYYGDFIQLFEISMQGLLSKYGFTDFSDASLDSNRFFKGQIQILTDRQCASSCESAIQFFEKLPNVTRIGENTGGYLQYGGVGTLLLPNSHLLISLPTQAFKYFDGRMVEKIGYAPDVRVAPGTDALDVALRRF
jgi:hypothetical protein